MAKSSGFVLAESRVKPRLIASIDGLEKCGKDHFSFTAPGPIAVISIDTGLEGVIQKFQKDKKIYVSDHQLPLTEGMTIEKAAELSRVVWKGIRADYADALATPDIRTIVCDTGTEMWESCRMSWFGKLTEVMPHHYAKPNGEWRNLVRMAFDGDKQVLFLHKLKDEYVGKNRTGEFKRSGMSDMGFLVQMAGRCWKDAAVQAVPDKFHFLITDCRHKPELEGLDFPGEECNFPTVASWVLYGDDQHVKEFL
jgi:hypothetical protein